MSTVRIDRGDVLALYTDEAIALKRDGIPPEAATEVIVARVLSELPADTDTDRMLRVFAENKLREMWEQACRNARVLTR